jgi:acetyl/propionyl-CoA carboxylase alpha subunit
MFDKILIANRGEIALRVVRACRELGIPSVVVYSTADADSLAVRLADEAVAIGKAAARASYLHIPNIIGAALKTGADAIHPGYGFLSEDPYFAEICAGSGITFIGPSPEVMEVLGDKSDARRLMSGAGLPLLPGTLEPVNTAADAVAIADEIGFPVVLKAVAGVAGVVSAWSAPAATWRTPSRERGPARATCSTILRCIWRNTSTLPGTSRCRCWPTSTATPSTSASGTARSSGATRS